MFRVEGFYKAMKACISLHRAIQHYKTRQGLGFRDITPNHGKSITKNETETGAAYWLSGYLKG